MHACESAPGRTVRVSRIGSPSCLYNVASNAVQRARELRLLAAGRTR
jgi:hypothetical protein